MRRIIAMVMLAVLMGPVTGSLVTIEPNKWTPVTEEGLMWMPEGYSEIVPLQELPSWAGDDTPWWERTTLDLNRNSIHDSLETYNGTTGIGLSYGVEVTSSHLFALTSLNLTVIDVIESVNAVLLGQIDSNLVNQLAGMDDVVMVERYGNVVLYGDIQTPAVKARNSTAYPVGAWDLGVSGVGVNIAMVDTGVDNEHPGLNEKFIAGYDAVCYLTTDPTCYGDITRRTDGTYDPDDGNQHGTACMGMAAASGIDASGTQTDFYGAAPDADLIDVRIGTDAGAGPFENYVLEQEFYESAMNGIQWIIDNKDTAWQGADEMNYGIDVLSLSWGITSHEGGGSDGEDMHSRILNRAMEAGIVVSVAAGNDGPDNDGLSGMGSSNLAITVGATDDINTVERSDDTVASYSSRGPRRDNGDSNPLNELKPEVSAPGTNIVQAEGCVTSGACINLLGGSAEDNGYTGRGSGTSYATPSVSGILALMIEANPDLSPAEMKEILKLTSERRGEPTVPEVDPFWNRDFGWGMVDALAAVELSFFMKDNNLTGQVDVTSQVHILDSYLNTTSGLYEVRGIAWGQEGSISAVEGRFGQGEWMQATYEVVEGGLSALQRFEWVMAFNPNDVEKGEQILEVRGLNSEGVSSLPVFTTVLGTDDGADELSGFSFTFFLSITGILCFLIIVGLLFKARAEEPLLLIGFESNTEHPQVLDAELVLDEPSSSEDNASS